MKSWCARHPKDRFWHPSDTDTAIVVQVRELRAEMKQMRALNERLRSLAESVRQISGCPDEVYAILDEALEHSGDGDGLRQLGGGG